MRPFKLYCLAALSILTAAAMGQTTAPSSPMNLGGPKFDGWTGLQQAADHATLAVPGTAGFIYPAGPVGFRQHGFRATNDSTADWWPLYGVRFDVQLPDARETELTVSIVAATSKGPDRVVPAAVRLTGAGWHSVVLPWSAFDFKQAGTSFLRFVKGLSIAGKIAGDSSTAQIGLRDVRVVKAASVAVECDVRGKPAEKGQTAEYAVQLSNCTNEPESVSLSMVKHGWETMEATVEPSAIQLQPGESKPAVVRVTVSPRVAAGGHEQQVLQAIANGDAAMASQLSFITVSELPHPYIMHTPARWQEVREKVQKYDWAKDAQAAYVNQAEKWVVPEVAKPPGNDPDDNMGPYLFHTQDENMLLACAYSWQLTGNKQHAEKVALWLRRLSDPANGYPVTLRGCNQGSVQEGHFFQHISMAYDMIQNADVLSDADRKQIETTLRTFIESMERLTESGPINNWNLSQDCGAFYCALAMQDLVAGDRFFAGPGGIQDQLAKGTMDDGWWYECSISYNMWCASEFTQVGLAYEAFGYNFKTAWVPASYAPSVMLTVALSGGNGVESPDAKMKGKPFGMDPSVYGPTRRPYRTITDLWNSLLPFIDYRGVMFGVNDSTEAKVAGNRTEVSGQPFEIAYYAYRDPLYATLIKMGGGKRDLLYAVPDLPEKTPEQFRDSAYADNVGLSMLRSQTPNRPIKDQIQATLHYGTHGWAHGHYDRTDLLSLMRYGRSFWNPESVFYVYEPFMYKFFTQTSDNHNMVVVDQKMQEATPGDRLLFHTGSAMQATAVQDVARWSNPPYGGMVYDYVPVKTFEEKTWREGRYVPIPKNPPAYGTLTDFTEPVLQRRLMVVTDDYVVLADYLKGERPHTFDSLFQLKGFKGIEGGDKTFLRHAAQWNPDPVGSAQFVTDCNWYTASAPAVAKFEERWGADVDDEGSRSVGNEPGVLKLDVHSLWPPKQEIMVANAPEQRNVEKRLWYTVTGDGKSLAEGKFGAWILGRGDIDVPVDGVKQLRLQTKTELSKRPTLFWAGAVVVTADGKEIPLATLPLNYENIVPTKGPDQDYLGGPVKIAGDEYKNTIAAEPKDQKQPGTITVDLTGVSAVRLKAVVGSDYPPGDESDRRKTYAIRAPQSNEARFITIIEPYQDKAMIVSATAPDADHLHVELSDGRVQDIALTKVDGDGSDIQVSLKESHDGKETREESTASSGAHPTN